MDLWHAVKVKTTNGPRIGIIQDPDGFEILAECPSQEIAAERCGTLSALLDIPEFTESDTMYIC